MANKFQKSVIERLEQDAARQKHKTGNTLSGQAAPPPVTEIKNGGNDVKKSTSIPDIRDKPAKETITLPTAVHLDTEAGQKPAVLPDIRDNPVPIKETESNYTAAYQFAGEDIGDYIRQPQQRLAKNKTFYLDTDVIEAIRSVAKKQGLTESRLVNDILRHVLGPA